MDRGYIRFHGSQIIEQGAYDVTWDLVRKERNHALTECDWRAVKDRTLTTAWKEYRKALRDLPQTYDNANDAADNWPAEPEVTS